MNEGDIESMEVEKDKPAEEHKISDVKVELALIANKKVVHESGVFLLYHGSEVVYVAKSFDVHASVTSHYKSKVFDSWNFVPCSLLEQDEIVEDLVLAHKPYYNNIMQSTEKWVSRTRAKNKFGVYKSKFDKMLRDGTFSKVAYFKDTYVLKEELINLGFVEV